MTTDYNVITDNTERPRIFSNAEVESLGASLKDKRGREYWRSLQDMADTPAFQDFLYREFPLQASAPITDVTRRNFMKVMGASLALAGVTGCWHRQPDESILPYVKQPEEVVPGKPLYFASACQIDGYARGVLVESHMGRPTKIEGLPEHPSSMGRTDVWTQASVLNLYDPDRAQVIQRAGLLKNWDDFVAEIGGVLRSLQSRQGRGVHILTETVTSPTLADQLRRFQERHPGARWHQYSATGHGTREGARIAFGEYVNAVYNFDRADRILSLDSDFLYAGPGHVRYAYDFAQRRDVVESGGELPRMYAIESTPTVTGANADHRIPVKPSEVGAFARAIAAAVGAEGVGADGPAVREALQELVAVVAADLQSHTGRSVVIAGDTQPPVVHALAHAMNVALGNDGQTVVYTAPVEAMPVNHLASLRELTEALNNDQVELLIILGGNPVYNAPVDFDFGSALLKARLAVRVGLYDDETAALCTWTVPESHYLEAWGDARAHDGTVSLVQPVIAPLYRTRSAYEVMSALVDETPMSGHDAVRSYWRQQRQGENFDLFWSKALSIGMVENTGMPAKRVSVAAAGGDSAEAIPDAPDSAEAEGAEAGEFELVFAPDPSIWDGTYSNNAWLQETPKPLTKVTWDNAVYVSPVTAKRNGWTYDDNQRLVRVTYRDRSIQGPLWILPGVPDNTVLVHFGYGRTRCGLVAQELGFNAYSIWTSDTGGYGTGARIEALDDFYELAVTEEHHTFDYEIASDRGIIRTFPIEVYRESIHVEDTEVFEREGQPEIEKAGEPRGAHVEGHHVASVVHEHHHAPGEEFTLYKPDEKFWPGNAWGMVIDLNKCIGCNACIVACVAENNIPVVGKTEVRNGREMLWLRVDRYYQGETENPEMYFAPVPCMQCENAPCEPVCPVGATQHSAEGLNDMVYNRCIGTRYCANNCPYKVRRFNFYNYSRTPLGKRGERMFPKQPAAEGYVYPETVKVMRNPEVTIRTRGVMEKCTYCVQRINRARIESKIAGEEQVPDGAVVTACQQACPATAIQFGNLHAPNSTVAKLKESPRNYTMLADLNTRPRTSYLARMTNPNPQMPARFTTLTTHGHEA